jgi:hypothetical protein
MSGSFRMGVVHAGQSKLAMPFRRKLSRKSMGLVDHCLMVQHDP